MPRRARPPGSVLRALAAIAPAALAACVLGDVDLAGKACPCASGWTCDTASGTCVRGGAPPGPVGGPDGGDDDASSDGAPPPEPRIVPSAFKAAWTTGTTVGWTWSTLGDPADFDHWEIVVAPTLEDLTARSLKCRTFGPAQAGELAQFDRVDRKGHASIPRFFATTYGHGLGAPVFAVLVAVDKQGARSETPVAEAKTLEPTDQIVVFAEAAMPGESTPATFERSSGAAAAGTFKYSADVACAPGEASCYLQLIRRKLEIAFPPTFNQAAFERAWVTMQVAGDVRVPGESTSVSLLVGGPDCLACRQTMVGFFDVGETYRAYEAPLRELRNPNGKLTFAVVRQANTFLSGVQLAGTWKAGARVRVDEIRVRW